MSFPDAPKSELSSALEDRWYDANGATWKDANGEAWVAKTGSNRSVVVTTASQLYALDFKNVTAGKRLGFVSDVATQLVFGDESVAVGTDDPPIPANKHFYCIPPGTHLAFKGASAGKAYIWFAGSPAHGE
jgi:hypothetical protein